MRKLMPHQETSEEQEERWRREDQDFDQRDMAETWMDITGDGDDARPE
jgi:hypothetical protein